MNAQLFRIIDRYPLLFPRLYNYLRILILPITEIAKYVPEEGTIIDVGCGYGLLDIYLAKNSPKRKVIGSEFNGKRVKIASQVAKNIENVQFVEKNLLDSGQSEKVDCFVLIDLLHHVTYEQQQDLLKSVYGLLRQGGTLVLKDMDTQPTFKYYWNLVHDKLMTGFDKLYFIGAKELTAQLQAQGFIVSCRKIWHPFYAHYIVICEKK